MNVGHKRLFLAFRKNSISLSKLNFLYISGPLRSHFYYIYVYLAHYVHNYIVI